VKDGKGINGGDLRVGRSSQGPLEIVWYSCFFRCMVENSHVSVLVLVFNQSVDM
jgi:hypothetical protein